MADIALFMIDRRERRRRRAERVFRDRRNFLEELRDDEVVTRYRLTREAILGLEGRLEEHLSPRTQRSQAIPPMIKILVSLRFLAKGDFLSEVSDLHGISKSSASRCLEEFVDAINHTLNNIRFQLTQQDLRRTKYEFYQKAKLPGVIGAIDGTLIPIMAPKEHEEAYVCRKGYHAINVQAVVDSKLRFNDVVARWPGSMHDSAIFNNCALKDYLEANDVGHLVGDSGYALRGYLLTPLGNPATAKEITYNNAHAKTRVVVERAFGVLKSRFRCLHKTGGSLPYSPTKCCKIITACMKLHNLCVELNVPFPENVDINEDEGEYVNDNGNATGQQRRQQIINVM